MAQLQQITRALTSSIGTLTMLTRATQETRHTPRALHWALPQSGTQLQLLKLQVQCRSKDREVIQSTKRGSLAQLGIRDSTEQETRCACRAGLCGALCRVSCPRPRAPGGRREEKRARSRALYSSPDLAARRLPQPGSLSRRPRPALKGHPGDRLAFDSATSEAAPGPPPPSGRGPARSAWLEAEPGPAHGSPTSRPPAALWAVTRPPLTGQLSHEGLRHQRHIAEGGQAASSKPGARTGTGRCAARTATASGARPAPAGHRDGRRRAGNLPLVHAQNGAFPHRVRSVSRGGKARRISRCLGVTLNPVWGKTPLRWHPLELLLRCNRLPSRDVVPLLIRKCDWKGGGNRTPVCQMVGRNTGQYPDGGAPSWWRDRSAVHCRGRWAQRYPASPADAWPRGAVAFVTEPATDAEPFSCVNMAGFWNTADTSALF